MSRKRRASISLQSNESLTSSTNNVNPTKKKKGNKVIKKCNVCNQGLCDAKTYNPDEKYLEEFTVITDEELNIGGEQDDPQYLINDFTIYCENKHICKFEGLIEQDAALYATGDLYKLVDADFSKKGHPAKIGPILSWYLEDIDESMQLHIVLSTECAFYVLKKPSDLYIDQYRVMEEKFILSNQIINFIQEEENDDTAYEDLLLCLDSLDLSTSLTVKSLNEEHLHNHAQFVVDQLQIENRTFLEHSSIVSLMDLTGAKISDKKHTLTNIVKKNCKSKKQKQKPIPVVTSKIVHEMMKGLFPTLIDNTSKENQGKLNDRIVTRRSEDLSCNDSLQNQTISRQNIKLSKKCKQLKVEELSLILHDKTKSLYKEAKSDQQLLKVFDCIVIPKTEELQQRFGYIVNIFTLENEDVDEDKPVYAHIILMIPSQQTLLSDSGDPHEFFLIKECCDVLLTDNIRKISIEHLNSQTNLNESKDLLCQRSRYNKLFYQKWYVEETARFEDLPNIVQQPPIGEHVKCYLCEQKSNEKLKESILFGEELSKKGKLSTYKSFEYNGENIFVNDSLLLKADSFKFDLIKPKQPNNQRESAKNKKLYPEYHRKNCYVKGNAFSVDKPFQIGLVKSIIGNKNKLSLLVQKFYRPEDTILQPKDYVTKGLNEVFWSDEVERVEISDMISKCSVRYSTQHEVYDELEQMKEPSFYYKQKFDAKSKKFSDLPDSKGSSSSTKLKKTSYKKLATMEVFAGCGGLSEGLKQSGVADLKWAIEIDSSAAESYKKNNPQTKVFTQDSSVIFRDLLSDSEEVKKQYPRKGEVELLCGGPPCQGYSGINRHFQKDYSKFQNTLVAGFLSYCDYYRPRFIIIENVRRLMNYGKGNAIKVIMAVLLRFNYQCTFAILQAGHYGVPQTRCRAIILAAAPGEKLPFYPEPLYTFSSKYLKVHLDGKVYVSNIKNLENAPMRHITVRDAISDLPEIVVDLSRTNNESKQTMNYTMEPKTSFQQNIRFNSKVLNDHYCRVVTALNQARIEHIPRTPGSDWRDLPNKRMMLKDGSYLDVLDYKYNYTYKGRKMKGVCKCVLGQDCDKEDKQSNTLIPWCLPHTADKNNHWAGLFGRMTLDGFFGTVVTAPVPIGKQGNVLHPEQHRLVSVRECARSQGFPDHYQFCGTITEKYCQIGNAVPPPMAKAIGLELLRCIES